MDLIIFCQASDAIMYNLREWLIEKGYSVCIITDTELAFAKSIVHSCDKFGKFETVIELANGTTIDFLRVKCVLNRLEFISMIQFQNLIDRQYADLEMYALFISMLQSFSKILLLPFLPHHLCNIQNANKFQVHKMFIDAGLPVSDKILTNNGNRKLSAGKLISYDLTLQYTEWKRKIPNYELNVKKPTQYEAKLISKNIIECVGDSIVVKDAVTTQYCKEIKKLASYLSFPILKIGYGKIENSVKFYSIDIRPMICSNDVLIILERKIIEKIHSHDNYSRNTKRISYSVSN